MLKGQHGTSGAGESGLEVTDQLLISLVQPGSLGLLKLPQFADTQHRSDSAPLRRARSLKTGWEMLRGAGRKRSSRVSHQ